MKKRLIVVAIVCLGGWRLQMLGAETRRDDALSTESVVLDVNKVKRSYLVHLPESDDKSKRWPVVIMFHGGGGNGKLAMSDTGWAAKADKEGFIAVFPEGTSPDPSRPGRFLGNPQTWNDGSKRPTVGAAERGEADIAFVSAIIDDLKKRYQVNHRQIYVTGFSNGASLSFRIARELSSAVAAFAPVAGHDWVRNRPDRPVPVIYVVGAADPLCPVAGGEVFIGRKPFGKKPGTREMLAKWVKLHKGLDKPRIVYDKNGAVGEAFSRPNEGETVVLYTIDGHGHHWPGGKTLLGERIAGKNTSQLQATDVIWDFFKTHSLPK
ncbi:Alpha/beta hydrolase family protein [Crateriforma conspicua]|uniref:Alpha/beta hydrolase family protein n=1 Tax=Crateriforma conspicua TaxID=2527996 RepID=A0A5C6FQ46_9PLAN|nr:PHB depolymerase family esterase [Crateriforma conspicua]TWU62606.1 Alpha/beta hydrolase family protein [Crateriforma conspicua]